MNLPLLKSNLNTPKIMWHQTDLLVRVHILLVDVKKYYVRVDRDRLCFSTILNNTKYYVIINLFGAVIPEKCTNRNTGREIQIYIPKGHKGADWLRLQLEPEKNLMIVVDPDRVQVPEWRRPLHSNISEDMYERSFEEYKRHYKIRNVMPDEPSTDEGESDDEIYDTYFD